MKFAKWLKLSVLFVLVFNVFSISTSAQTDQKELVQYAAEQKLKKFKLEGVSEDVLDQYLLDTGVPQEKLSTIAMNAKKTIYASQAKFLSVKEELKPVTEGNQNISGIEPMRADTWDADLFVFQAPSPRSGTVALMLMYNWTWDNHPNYIMQDQFGIAWTDDFNAMQELAEYEYTATGSNFWTGACSSTVGDYDYIKYTPGKGIGWKISLFGKPTDSCQYTQHSGYGIVTIVTEHNNSGNIAVSDAVGTYFHQFISYSGTLTFSGTPSIDITASASYDKFPDEGSGPIYWYHEDF